MVEETKVEKRKRVKETNALLVITLLVYVIGDLVLEIMANIFGGFFSETMFRLIAGQMLLLLPSIIYLKKKKLKIREVISFKMLHPATIVCIFIFTMLSYPIVIFCNYLSLLVSENTIANTINDVLSVYPTWFCVIAIALIPCCVEEFLFRGVLADAYKRSGMIKAAFFTALMFGLLHMKNNQMSYAIVMGILFFALNEVTGSILSSMLVHFIINGISVVSSATYIKQYGDLPADTANQFGQNLFIIVGLGIISLVCIGLIMLLLWAMMYLEKRVDILKEEFVNTKEKCRLLSPILVIYFAFCIWMMFL